MANKAYDQTLNRAESDVRGWLDGLEDLQSNNHPYTAAMSQNIAGNGTAQSDRNGEKFIRRPQSAASISSQDSINLDDIIRSNDTIDIQETGLMPYLEDLDIDDANDEFWKMDEALTNLHIAKNHPMQSVKAASKTTQPHPSLKMLSDNMNVSSKHMEPLSSDLDDTSSESSLNNQAIDAFDVDHYWSESLKDEADRKRSADGGLGISRNSTFSKSNDSLSSENTILAKNALYASSISRRQTGGNIPIGGRSPSQSSENSYTSQSTMPVSNASGTAQTSPTSLRPCQSNSSSYRPSSRLSDYSVQSYGSASGLPRPKPTSNDKLVGSKSFSARSSIIAAKKSSGLKEPSMLPRMPSRPAGSMNTSGSSNTSKLAKRASHIPAPSKTRTTPIPQKTLSSYSNGRDSPSRMSSKVPAPPVPKLPHGTSSLRMTSNTSRSSKESSDTYPLSRGTSQVGSTAIARPFAAPKQPTKSPNSQFLNDSQPREPASMLPRRSMTPNAARSPSRIGVMRKP
ncbi:hypothetical protein K450DRAFT_251583 [Umbelopsis ramanniana AG]|uniref:Uncharacterized protein n=1 Tax=Umbelopsis ramanniana AG TaxID=1314678 RepID=A0AAD5E662_UMBRA|nr:uncharacterized protein K450DRAFT_251583 [Umbelopsis ramanniana AG]KAI8577597.1 hypothetical protein K450DRAFT_251583 [Umbelopsis ramanniana AG]